MDRTSRRKIWPFLLAGFLLLLPARSLFAETGYDCGAPENKTKPTTVEATLPQKWKGRNDEIQRAFTGGFGSVKMRIQFFPFLNPPANIGIGKCVDAEVARRAIREAIRYNGGVDRLIVQERMPHHLIKIGATDLDESTWIPIHPDALARLTDPALSTAQFQELYRSLAVQKERKLPFGMGSEKREERR